MTTLALLAILATAPLDTGFASIVVAQFHRHPAMAIDDLYKLTHQASFGSEHAVIDSATATAWLAREWDSMGASSGGPVFDTIAPGGALVRVNLREWRDQGGSRLAVLNAFLATARRGRGAPAEFDRHWNTVIELARRGVIAADPTELKRYGERMRARDYPAISHSERYRQLYQPAYRVTDPALVRWPSARSVSP